MWLEGWWWRFFFFPGRCEKRQKGGSKTRGAEKRKKEKSMRARNGRPSVASILRVPLPHSTIRARLGRRFNLRLSSILESGQGEAKKRENSSSHQAVVFSGSYFQSSSSSSLPTLTKGNHAGEAPDGRVELLDAAHELVPCVDVDASVLVGHASRGARGGRASARSRSRSRSSCARNCRRRRRRHHRRLRSNQRPASSQQRRHSFLSLLL